MEFVDRRRESHADITDVGVAEGEKRLILRRNSESVADYELSQIHVWWRSDHYTPIASGPPMHGRLQVKPARYRRALGLTVAEVMTRDPICVGSGEPLDEAGALLEMYAFNAVPVVDDHWKLLGVLTKLDILKAFLDPTRPPLEVLKRPVGEFMTTRMLTVTPTSEIAAAARLMVDSGHKSLPVVESGILQGMIAREDVLRSVRMKAEDESSTP
ncbi:MAG: CBS domain-containing protein [Myxococcota bacterium]